MNITKLPSLIRTGAVFVVAANLVFAQSSTPSLKRRLLGSWSRDSYEIQKFFPNGTGIYIQGDKECYRYRYHLKGNVLRVIPKGKDMCPAYDGQGNELPPDKLEEYRISFKGRKLIMIYLKNGYTSTWEKQ